MRSYSSRPFAGATDLRQMQAAVAQAFSHTQLRVGDVAWLARRGGERDLSGEIHLWESGSGEVVAWTFFRPNGGFNLFVSPGWEDGVLVSEMLDVIEEAVRRCHPESTYTYGIDITRSASDISLAAELERRGFEAQRSGGVLTRSVSPRAMAEPAVPPVYRLGAVLTSGEIAGRVAASRAAFASSDLTIAHYRHVRGTWPYRPELDRIAVTDDGEVVAFCTAWLDEDNTAGLLEPVGTHPDHRRRGLGSAVCLDALGALAAAGARTVEVGYNTDAAYAMYRSIGFEPSRQNVSFRRACRV